MSNVRETRSWSPITNKPETMVTLGRQWQHCAHETASKSQSHTHTHIENTNKMSPMEPHQENTQTQKINKISHMDPHQLKHSQRKLTRWTTIWTPPRNKQSREEPRGSRRVSSSVFLQHILTISKNIVLKFPAIVNLFWLFDILW